MLYKRVKIESRLKKTASTFSLISDADLEKLADKIIEETKNDLRKDGYHNMIDDSYEFANRNISLLADDLKPILAKKYEILMKEVKDRI